MSEYLQVRILYVALVIECMTMEMYLFLLFFWFWFEYVIIICANTWKYLTFFNYLNKNSVCICMIAEFHILNTCHNSYRISSLYVCYGHLRFSINQNNFASLLLGYLMWTNSHKTINNAFVCQLAINAMTPTIFMGIKILWYTVILITMYFVFVLYMFYIMYFLILITYTVLLRLHPVLIWNMTGMQHVNIMIICCWSYLVL